MHLFKTPIFFHFWPLEVEHLYPIRRTFTSSFHKKAPFPADWLYPCTSTKTCQLLVLLVNSWNAQGQWKYVPHLSQPDPTLAVVIPTHDERTIQRLQEVTSFIRWEKREKQNFVDSVSWTTPESELKSMFGCCFAVPPCIAAASGFHNLAAWKPEERLSVTFYFKMLTATSSSWWFSQPWQHWNTWAIIAIIIRRIIINLQLCDEAIKDTTQERPSMIHGHTLSPSFGEPPWHLYQSVY